MRRKTEYRAIRCYPEDFELLRIIRDQIQERNPNLSVNMADAMAACVGSMTAVLAGGSTPVAITAPPLVIRSDQAA